MVMKFASIRLKQLGTSTSKFSKVVVAAMKFHSHPGFRKFSQTGDLDLEWYKSSTTC